MADNAQCHAFRRRARRTPAPATVPASLQGGDDARPQPKDVSPVNNRLALSLTVAPRHELVAPGNPTLGRADRRSTSKFPDIESRTGQHGLVSPGRSGYTPLLPA